MCGELSRKDWYCCKVLPYSLLETMIEGLIVDDLLLTVCLSNEGVTKIREER